MIVEKASTDERNGSGGSYQKIEGCHTHLLGSKERHYQVENQKSGHAIQESRKHSFGLRALVRKIDPDIVIVRNSTQILFLTRPRKYKLGVVAEDICAGTGVCPRKRGRTFSGTSNICSWTPLLTGLSIPRIIF
ncbi:MAG: hypothetical protein MR636_02010 [Clostridiales bacterium]|nr:hypothetical protein [Clostridiales bacterium]